MTWQLTCKLRVLLEKARMSKAIKVEYLTTVAKTREYVPHGVKKENDIFSKSISDHYSVNGRISFGAVNVKDISQLANISPKEVSRTFLSNAPRTSSKDPI